MKLNTIFGISLLFTILFAIFPIQSYGAQDDYVSILEKYANSYSTISFDKYDNIAFECKQELLEQWYNSEGQKDEKLNVLENTDETGKHEYTLVYDENLTGNSVLTQIVWPQIKEEIKNENILFGTENEQAQYSAADFLDLMIQTGNSELHVYEQTEQAMVNYLINKIKPNAQLNSEYVDYTDPNESNTSLFQKACDLALGIVLYPLKLILLALGAIFNIVVKGIASIGGEAGEGLSISLQDIIFTTSTMVEGTVHGESSVPIVAIDFFNITGATSEVAAIRQGVANWFYVFRNLSIVISLCILIYTGVRMAISSIAEDKAKYKTMLTNWAVQMVLVFFMQYIIFFTIGINTGIVDALNPAAAADTTDYMDRLYQQAWVPTLTTGFGSAIVYCVLLGMTFSFLIMYIKRMITIGFLIIISPLVTVTYAIDKMGDSKSQALNTWLKEFVYNVLIQPFHCIIYMVFVSTAMNLLINSPIGNLGTPVFAIVCIMFMSKAEDILRKIFAFDKNSKTLGSGLASAAMLGTGISTVSKMFKNQQSSKKAGPAKGETMPNIEEMRQNQAEQNAKDKQIDEVQQAADPSVQKASQQAASNKDVTNTAKQIEKDRRKNRRIESWQNAGGVAGVALKGAELTTKASLPVFTALLGAGQGNLKSAVAAGTAGYTIEKGIGNAIENRGNVSQREMSRQAKANEAAMRAIYDEQARKWKQTDENGKKRKMGRLFRRRNSKLP